MVELDFASLLSRYKMGEREFKGCVVHAVDGFECNLRDIDLSASVLIKAYLPYSNLSQAKLVGSTAQKAALGDIKLFSANLSNAILAGSDLSRADLRYACLKGADLKATNLSGADLQGADLTGADLTGSLLSNVNLAQAILAQTCLREATLFRSTGADLRLAICDRTTILPDGHHY
ncbi:MAG: pentapeptide repeat-containing protein [Cyanobacteria bacterium P01_H01_bin.58]